ncbi:MAG: ATP-binding protein [bacterium]
MTPYILTTLIATFINLSLTVFVFIKNPKKEMNRVFSLLCFCVTIWCFTAFTFSFVLTKELVFLLGYIFYTGLIFIPPASFHTAVLLTKFYSKRKKFLIIIAYIYSSLLLIINWTGLLFKDFTYYEFGHFYFPIAGKFYFLFPLSLFFFIGYGTYLLYKKYITTKNPGIKNRFKYIAMGGCVGIGGGISNVLLVAGVEVYPIAHLTIAYCMAIFAYAIFKYRLMEIDIIIRKGFVYTTLTGALTTVLVSTIVFLERTFRYTTGYEAFMGTVIAVAIVTIIFQPLREKIQLIVDKHFFRERFDQQEFLKKVGMMLTTTVDKDVLLPPIMKSIVQTMHLDGASVMLLNEREGIFRREFEVGEVGHRDILKITHPVVKWFKTEKRELLKEEIRESRELEERSELLAQLKKLGATVSVPLFYKEELLGILNLGDKFAGKPYDKEDLTFLSSLAGEISVALENTKLYDELKQKVIELKKMTEELQIANEAKSTFLNIVSHELRTPLTVIMGYLQLLSYKALGEITDEQIKGIDIMLEKCKHLNELIGDILDLSKIERGKKYELKKQPVDFKKIVEEVILIFTPQSQEKKIVLQSEVDPNIPIVMYDKERAKEILSKLVDNAIKFIKKDKKDTKMKVTIRLEDKGKYLQGCVEDTGIGIKKENFDKITDRFYQLDMSDTRSYEGTGLGLAIVKEILDESNGTIRVESEVGKGSKFIFTIPKEEVPEEELPKIRLSKKKPPHQTIILIVDDNLEVLKLSELYLKTNGYRVKTAKDGVEALEKLYVEKPDLIIFSLRVPKVDGYEMAHILRDHEETKEIPLIMLVPVDEEQNLDKIYKAGATTYLFKPFDFKDLMEEVVRLV